MVTILVDAKDPIRTPEPHFEASFALGFLLGLRGLLGVWV